jgi:hypothetical protein
MLASHIRDITVFLTKRSIQYKIPIYFEEEQRLFGNYLVIEFNKTSMAKKYVLKREAFKTYLAPLKIDRMPTDFKGSIEMDASYWAKKYHEAEKERVAAEKRIEELEDEVAFLEEAVHRLSGGKVKRTATPKPEEICVCVLYETCGICKKFQPRDKN